MKSRHLLAALAVALFVVAAPLGVHAATSERITNFVVAATLKSDSTLDVVETIDYQFGTEVRHGIYRDIPLSYTDDKSRDYRPEITVISASQDGSPIAVSQSRTGRQISLKIGDPGKTITDAHRYKIHYSLHPIIVPGDGHDILKFNVTGNNWTVPIMAASARFALPAGVTALASNCFTGPSGSKANNCLVTAAGQTIDTTTNLELPPGSGMSLFAELPKGATSEYLAVYVPPKLNPWLWLPVAVAGLLAVAGVMLMLAKMVGDWRQRKSRTVVAEYDPPDNLRPAELGLLVDDRSGMPEITATLIDLAVRGYMRIEQTRKKSLLSGAEYTFHKLDLTLALEPFEQSLMDGVFSKGSPAKMTELDRTKMAAKVESIHLQVGDRMKNRGWYFKRPSVGRWMLPAGLLIAAIILIGWAAGLMLLPETDFGPLQLLAIVLGAALASIVAVMLLRKPTGMTPAGATEWAKVRGFREYLMVAEKDRLNFSDAPDKTPERFNKLLPFAVALGVEKQWAKQFEGIDVAPASGWYGGYDPVTFSAVYLASSLNSDFTKGVTSNFTPLSSSGSSSSGFSGGGFGGGGGGSW